MEGEVALSQSAEYKDRSGWLVFFGIVHILLGALTALMVPFLLLAVVLSRSVPGAVPMRPRDIGFTLSLYAGLAVFFVWMGIGVIKLRRWARTLMLAFSWIWLVGGVFGVIFAVWILPQSMRQASAGRQPHPALMALLLTFIIGFMAVIYVVLPLVFVLFYQSRHVRATVESRDPVERWTDRCPFPVLIASLMFGCGGASLPLLGLMRPVLPFFGEFISGPAATAIYVALGALFLYLGWALYRLKPEGWRGAVATQGLWALSSGLTFWRHDLLEMYERMDMSPQQMQAIRNMPFFHGSWFVVWMISFAILFVGYLFSLRRYFVGAMPAA